MKSKKYYLNLSIRKVGIRLSPVRTSKSFRRKNRGLSIPVYLLMLPTKEIQVNIEKQKSIRRKATKKPLPSTKHYYLSFLLVVAGFSGIVYFSKQQAQTENQSIEPAKTFSVPLPSSNSAQNTKEQGLKPSKPVHIRVKKVGIDAPVMEVGQKKDKTMEVPPLFENVTGWYKLSPTPGEVGPSIIVGHVDTYKGPSVFYSLKDLNAGDIIEIKRADKKTVKFKVTALKQFSQDNFPTKEVYGNIDYAGLRLITCGGTFNEQTQRYTANTVVFAKMITDEKNNS